MPNVSHFPFRRRIIAVILAGLFFSGLANANQLQSIDIKAMLLGDKTPQLYYRNAVQGEYLPFNIGRNRIGSSNLLPPGTRSLVLYREQQTEAGTAMSPTINIPLPGEALLYLIFNYDANGNVIYQVLEDSAEIHPGGSLRLVNTTQNDVVFLLNGSAHPLKADADINLPIEAQEGAFTFSYAMERAGDLKRMIPTKMLRLIGPDSRLMMILTYRKYDREEGGRNTVVWKPHLTRVYSTVPKETDS